MKEIKKHENIRILRFDPDEEAVAGIISYCEENNIKAGWLNMLGASGKVTLMYYNLETKKYEPRDYEQNLEVLAVTGNVGTFNHKTIVHAHGSFSDQNFQVVGGHIDSLTVSATLEVRIEVFPGEIMRKFDEFTGLKLMCPL